jgi:hypothetical protein
MRESSLLPEHRIVPFLRALAGEDVNVEDVAVVGPVVSASTAAALDLPVQAASPPPNQAASFPQNYQRIGKILFDIGCCSKLHLFEENELDDDLLDDMTEEHFTLAGLSSDEVIMFRKRLGAHAAANASVEIDEEAQMLRDMEAMMQALEQKSSFVASPAHDSANTKTEATSTGMMDSFSGGVGKLFSGVSFLSGTKDSASREAASVGAQASTSAPVEEEIGFGKKLMSFKISFGSKDAESDAGAEVAESESLGKKLFSGFGSFGKKS